MATVLLVDDDAAVLRMAAAILKRAGFQVIRASNGLEALQVYESYAGHIDLLVTDLDMPEISGLELVARLSAIHPSIRVVVTSGGPRLEDPALRRYPIVSKPFGAAALLQAVRAALRETARPRRES